MSVCFGDVLWLEMDGRTTGTRSTIGDMLEVSEMDARYMMVLQTSPLQSIDTAFPLTKRIIKITVAIPASIAA